MMPAGTYALAVAVATAGSTWRNPTSFACAGIAPPALLHRTKKRWSRPALR
jgi:hypothetical protein